MIAILAVTRDYYFYYGTRDPKQQLGSCLVHMGGARGRAKDLRLTRQHFAAELTLHFARSLRLWGGVGGE